MATANSQYDQTGLIIKGSIEFEAAARGKGEPGVYAHALDATGAPIGTAPVSEDGTFEMRVPLKQAADVSIAVTPEANPASIRASQSHVTAFKASDWQRNALQPQLRIPRDIWWPWRPIRVCVNGHVQKVVAPDVPGCPVPFVKVEVFDVDREACWWPWLLRAEPHLIDPRVLDIPKLINPPFPPDPIGPVALAHLGDPAAAVAFNPQPDPPLARVAHFAEPIERVALNPQPLPPREQVAGPTDPTPWSEAFSFAAADRAPLKAMAATPAMEISAKLRDLTLTSLIGPWDIFPHCFYSRQLVCTTYTDCNGDWECCFNWWPLHVRHGRFRFDPRPDIIIRVTQVINGVSTVIYMDPYSSTRWNATGATINLSLNDPRVVCGPGCEPGPHLGHSQASLLQVGSDPTWTINQANGLYETPPTSNAAFGGSLYLRGDFSADLKTSGLLHYRLQWKKSGAADSTFQPIMTGLSALRATPFGSFSDYTLGPKTVGVQTGLYEVQDAFHWWLMPGVPGGPGTVIGLWDTSFEDDEDTYVIRMDMFDALGAPLGSIQYPNHGGDGSGVDPAPPPIVVGQLDTVVHVDNKPVEYSLGIPAANTCGIIPWTPTLPLTLSFQVHASQENGRVHEWNLYYSKGTTAVGATLGDVAYNAGLSPVSVAVAGGVMLVDPSTPSGYVESSCAYALRLQVWAHIRGNWGYIWYGEKLYAIAVERCICLPIVL
jgi:hypothetical protein